MRVALVKTSSMGDVIHTLPVVTDLRRARPGCEIVWVVEEAFADIPRMHRGVGDVVTVALRRWRHALTSGRTWREYRAARDRLAERPFDLVLDLQGLLKSAWIARWARGPRAGPDRQSAREPLAAWFYDRRFPVDARLHAIERGRQLAGRAAGYQPDGLPEFDLTVEGGRLSCAPATAYVVLLHATSRAEKQWPAERWRALARRLVDAGRVPVLPWGNDAERRAAESLAQGIASASVLPRLSLADCGRLMRDAAAIVGVDTGLTHLAAGLGRPTVALFAATPAWRFGPYWSSRAVNLGADGRWPDVDDVVQALASVLPE